MAAIDALRTPDDRFANLPGFSFEPNYVDDLPGYAGLRMHYLDEGPSDAEVTFFCVHGEPTWSYLYRKMIPVFTGAGHRAIAPDLFGFGKSDKPKDDAVYTYGFHHKALSAFFERMDLRNVCLVVQDWGGILGLTLPMAFSDRITRLIVMNTALPAGESPGKGFEDWRAFVKSNPDFDVTQLMRRSTPVLSDAEAAAYGAPYPTPDYMGGARRFPELVMTDPGMEGIDVSLAARKFLQTEWSGESFMAVGKADPVLGEKSMAYLRQFIRGCPEPMIVEDGGHFVQEWGEDIARNALATFKL